MGQRTPTHKSTSCASQPQVLREGFVRPGFVFQGGGGRGAEQGGGGGGVGSNVKFT